MLLAQSDELWRTLWTHTSTAIEGNTLTLGETDFILNEGLTVSGKPLKDHKEVEGHAKAIEIVYSMLDKDIIKAEDIFMLHIALQTEIKVDIYQPTRTWKIENNGTYHIDEDDNHIFINYAEAQDIHILMEKWLEILNGIKSNLNDRETCRVYAQLHLSFVSIHPFADENGRMARLLSNMPVLRAGHPPITINNNHRREYIALLSTYQRNHLPSIENLFPPRDCEVFINFINNERKTTLELVINAYKEQEKRNTKFKN